jgi:hypothetical protein
MVYQIDTQTCGVVVLRIFLRLSGGFGDGLDPDGSEVPDLKSRPSPAKKVSFVLREDCDTGSEVQIATT